MKVEPEARLVALCVREPDLISPSELSQAAGEVRDWERVVELAIRHRVVAFLLQSGVDLPREIAAELRAAALSAQAVAMLLDAELERVGQALGAAGVPVLVLKGPALARELYPDPRLRPYADLDLSVHEQDEERAATILTECGYRELVYDSQNLQHGHVGHLEDGGGFHRLFGGANERALIELRLDPLQLGVRAACEPERWARALPIGGLPGLLMLAPEDQVVQLSVHAHKHGFSRLIWLKDLDLLLRRHADTLDWDCILDSAEREGVGGSMWYALSLANVLLDLDLPEAIQRLRPNRAVRVLYRAIWNETAIVNLEGFMRWRSVQFYAGESLRGMLPSLLLMGRRSLRLRLLANVVLNR